MLTFKDYAVTTAGVVLGAATALAFAYGLYKGNAWMITTALAKPTNWWAVGVSAVVLYVELKLALVVLLYMAGAIIVLGALVTKRCAK